MCNKMKQVEPLRAVSTQNNNYNAKCNINDVSIRMNDNVLQTVVPSMHYMLPKC